MGNAELVVFSGAKSVWLIKTSNSLRVHPGLLLLVESTPFSTFGRLSRFGTPLTPQECSRIGASLLQSDLPPGERVLFW